ncbi:MAG: hypothetical protein ACLUNZ_02190 [Evtepia sp.]
MCQVRTAALPADDPVVATRLTRRTLQRAFYLAAIDCLGKEPPWGMLSGVRPVKLPTRAMEEGSTPRQAEAMLKHYHVSPVRRQLAMGCAQASLAVSGPTTGRDLAVRRHPVLSHPLRLLLVHLGIRLGQPAHPGVSRRPVWGDRRGRGGRPAGGKTVRTVYIGGGTPTTLALTSSKALLDRLHTAFDLAPGTEFTVEAGRPDTITREKLEAIRDGGGNRISVNPRPCRTSCWRPSAGATGRRCIRQPMPWQEKSAWRPSAWTSSPGSRRTRRRALAATLDEVIGMDRKTSPSTPWP